MTASRTAQTEPFDFSKPWLRTDEAAAYVGYRGKHALRSFYRFLQKKGIPTARRFRVILVQRADLDRALGAGHRALSAKRLA
jgi:hypothetical protein